MRCHVAPAVMGLLAACCAAGQEYHEYPANRLTGVNVDQFIGSWARSETTVTHGVLIERVILRAGDPHKPGPPGAVLEYHEKLSLASLDAGASSAETKHPGQEILYVEEGRGELISGADVWPLREGVTVLIQPNSPHRLRASDDGPLRLVLIAGGSGGSTARSGILVRDRRQLPFAEPMTVWNYNAQCLFGPPDGLHANESVLLITMEPLTNAFPHSHSPHWEEVWLKLPPDGSWAFLGSEVRRQEPNEAFLVPPDGKTWHSVVNLGSHPMRWLYFSHYTEPVEYPASVYEVPGVAPLKIPNR